MTRKNDLVPENTYIHYISEVVQLGRRLLWVLGMEFKKLCVWRLFKDASVLYRRESILAIVVFPSQNNIVQCAFVVLQALGIENSWQCAGSDLVTHHKCRVDRPFPDHVIR